MKNVSLPTLLASIADKIGTLLLNCAQPFLNYAERQYADGTLISSKSRELTWDDLPRCKALLDELMRRNGEKSKVDPANDPNLPSSTPLSSP